MRVAVLLSGRGTNLGAIIRAARRDLPIDLVLAIADRPCAGIELARESGVPSVVVARSEFGSRSDFEQALGAHLIAANPDLVVLAGFMRVLSGEFVARWQGQMINIHPSLLPKYPGLDTHARALAAGEVEHGATVHYVTADLDAGPAIAQARMPILPGDTAESLAERLLPLEHALLVDAIRMFASADRA